jgi:hypothetical protein
MRIMFSAQLVSDTHTQKDRKWKRDTHRERERERNDRKNEWPPAVSVLVPSSTRQKERDKNDDDDSDEFGMFFYRFIQLKFDLK